jgi:hypothetical protein
LADFVKSNPEITPIRAEAWLTLSTYLKPVNIDGIKALSVALLCGMHFSFISQACHEKNNYPSVSLLFLLLFFPAQSDYAFNWIQPLLFRSIQSTERPFQGHSPPVFL